MLVRPNSCEATSVHRHRHSRDTSVMQAAPRLHKQVHYVSGSQRLRPGLPRSAHQPHPQLLLSLHDGEVSKLGVVPMSSHLGLTPAPAITHHHRPSPATSCHHPAIAPPAPCHPLPSHSSRYCGSHGPEAETSSPVAAKGTGQGSTPAAGGTAGQCCPEDRHETRGHPSPA